MRIAKSLNQVRALQMKPQSPPQPNVPSKKVDDVKPAKTVEDFLQAPTATKTIVKEVVVEKEPEPVKEEPKVEPKAPVKEAVDTYVLKVRSGKKVGYFIGSSEEEVKGKVANSIFPKNATKDVTVVKDASKEELESKEFLRSLF